MALSASWKKLTETVLSGKETAEFSAWAKRAYFGPNNVDKPWYREGVTEETVLEEFLRPQSPISPEALLEVWKAIPGLQAALGRLEESDLDSVADYLERNNEETAKQKYTKGEKTLKSMAPMLGTITGTMVNKLFVSGRDKLQRLTGNISFEDMDADELLDLYNKIEDAQEQAAKEYASSLLLFKGDIVSFIKHQIESLNLTNNEANLITEEEYIGLRILSEMEYNKIINVLLGDLDSEINLFRGFQNAASKKIFPRRSGRPKGSGKKQKEAVELEEDF